MTRLVYAALWIAAMPFVLLRLAWRSRRQPGYLEAVPERLGAYGPARDGRCIWIHAVSVGETRAAAPIIAALARRHPSHRILVTHMTPTGRATGVELFGGRVERAWLPYDMGFAVRRFLAHYRPRLGILLETEIWPRLLEECARAHVPVVLANARMSARSARRYARFPAFTRWALANLSGIAAQTAADAQRLRELGARTVEVTGNVKFDLALPGDILRRGAQFRARFGASRAVWVAGSTREGEESGLLAAFAAMGADAAALLVIVPRHPQRFDEVVAEARGTRGSRPRKKPARREVDTMDTFVCSSWYYLRFADPNNTKAFASTKALEKYLPVDFYMGGAEHTVLHLLYARFFTKALMQHGYLNFDEPFATLRHQGIILGEDGNKMSKSKGNVVNPDQIVKEFGADSLRLYEMFMGPLDDMKAWNTASIVGLRRFLEKVWKLQSKLATNDQLPTTENKSLESLMHKTIQKVTEDLETLKFNTAISSLMVLVNALEKESNISHNTFKILLTLLAPFAPHVTEELWQTVGEKQSIFLAAWPKYDAKKVVAETVKIAVQVNGKVRATIELSPEAREEDARAMALADTKVQTYLEGKTPRKIIYIPGKIVSIVV